MKFLISLIAGGISFWIAGASTYEITKTSSMAVPIGILIGVLVFIFLYKKLTNDKSMKKTIADGVSYIKTTSEDISSLVDDRDAEFYAIAEQEIKDDVINNGLWSQALVKAKGDENLRKIEYMKLRVKQLKKEKK